MKEEDIPCFASTFLLTFCGLCYTFPFFYFIGYVVYTPFNSYNFIIAGVTFGACALIVGAVFGMRFLVFWINKKLETSLETEARNDLIIGLGGMTLTAVIPRIMVYFMDYDPYTVAMFSTIFPITFFSFVIFFYNPKRIADFQYTKTPILPQVILLILQVILFFVFAKIGSYRTTTEEVAMIILTQLVCSVLILITVGDITVILAGNLVIEEVRAVPKRRNTKGTSDPRKPKAKPFDGTETQMDITVFCYALISVAAVITGIAYLTLIRFSWMYIGFVLIYFCGVYGVLEFVKFGVRKWNKRAPILEKYRAEVLLGLGGMMLAGIVPRILVNFVEINDVTIFSGVLLPLITFFLFYFHFVFKFREVCYFHYSRFLNVFWWNLGIHALILAVNIRVALIYKEEDKKFMEAQIWTHLLYFFMCGIAMIDFGIAWCGGFKLRDPDGEGKQQKIEMGDVENQKLIQSPDDVKNRATTPKPVVQKPKVQKPLPRITCPKCHQDYSSQSSKTPRILKECGHTVCEECADSLLKTHFNQHLFCPVCNLITVVQGPASTMKKNFMVMELVAKEGEEVVAVSTYV